MRTPRNEIVHIDGSTGDVHDRDGRLVAHYDSTSDLDTTDPIARGVVRVSYGETVEVPLANTQSQFLGDDYVAISGPSWWTAFAIFAAGWAGGYLAWVQLGKRGYGGGYGGLNGTPEEHSAEFDNLLDTTDSMLNTPGQYASGPAIQIERYRLAKADQESKWFSKSPAQSKRLKKLFAQVW